MEHFLFISFYLVKVPKSLYKVVDGVCDLLLRDSLQDGEEHLKADPALLVGVLNEAANVGLRRVLPEGAKDLADLLGLKKNESLVINCRITFTFYQVRQGRTWSRNYKSPSPTRFRILIF
jgi:hypothetical protein